MHSNKVASKYARIMQAQNATLISTIPSTIPTPIFNPNIT